MADDMITDAEIAEVMREAGERLTAAQHRADQAEARVAELAAAVQEHIDKLTSLARSFEVAADKEHHDRTAIAYGDACRCLEALCDKVRPVLARTPAAAAERVAAMEAALREIAAIVELPEVTEESTDCPGCGSMVDWRGDYEPDIGDRIACDECKGARLDEAGMIVRAALARLDAAGGDGDGHR